MSPSALEQSSPMVQGSGREMNIYEWINPQNVRSAPAGVTISANADLFIACGARRGSR